MTLSYIQLFQILFNNPPHLNDKKPKALSLKAPHYWETYSLDPLYQDSEEAVDWQIDLLRGLLKSENEHYSLWQSFAPMQQEAFKKGFSNLYARLNSQLHPNPVLFSLVNACWQRLPLYFADLSDEDKKKEQKRNAQFISALGLLNANTVPDTAYTLIRNDKTAQQELANRVAARLFSSDETYDVDVELLTLLATELSLENKVRLIRSALAEKDLFIFKSIPHLHNSVVMRELFKILNAPNKQVRMNACNALGAMKDNMEAEQIKLTAQEILKKLTDPDKSVRQIACRILGAMTDRMQAEQVKQVVQELLKKINDPEKEVRVSACTILETLVAHMDIEQVNQFVQVLLQKLDDPEESMRFAVCNALLATVRRVVDDEKIEQIVQNLENMLSDTQLSVRKAASLAAGIIAAHMEEQKIERFMQTLLQKLDGFDVNMRIIACDTLGVLAMTGKLKEQQLTQIKQRLLQILSQDMDGFVCASAAYALQAMEGYLKNDEIYEVVQKLLEILSNRDKNEELTAAEKFLEFGMMGLHALNTVKIMASRLEEEQICQVATQLLEQSHAAFAKTRVTACDALSDIVSHLKNEQIRPVIQVMAAKLSDPEWEVRAAACRTLEAMASRLEEEQIGHVASALLARLSDIQEHDMVFGFVCHALQAIVSRVTEQQQIERIVQQLGTNIIPILEKNPQLAGNLLETIASSLKGQQLMLTVAWLLDKLNNVHGDNNVDVCNALSAIIMTGRLEEKQLKLSADVLWKHLTLNASDEEMCAAACDALRQIWFHYPTMQASILKDLAKTLDLAEHSNFILFSPSRAQMLAFLGLETKITMEAALSKPRPGPG